MFFISAAQAAETGAAVEPSGVHNPELWVAVAFVVVVVLVGRKAAKAITGGLDSHAAKIRSKLDEARKLREDAQTLLADYQRRQKAALEEAEGIIAHARLEADRLKAEAEVALAASIARREAQALERIAQAEHQAIADVRNLAVDVAIDATTHLIAEKLPHDRATALVQAAIGDLPRTLN